MLRHRSTMLGNSETVGSFGNEAGEKGQRSIHGSEISIHGVLILEPFSNGYAFTGSIICPVCEGNNA